MVFGVRNEECVTSVLRKPLIAAQSQEAAVPQIVAFREHLQL